MIYEISTTEKFDKALKKLDRQTQRIIKAWIEKNLINCENPRIHGKALTSNRSGQWRYRVGDYRILAEIHDNKLVLILVDVGHRRDIYLFSSMYIKFSSCQVKTLDSFFLCCYTLTVWKITILKNISIKVLYTTFTASF